MLKSAVPKLGYPKQFNRLGDHVRARRFDLGLDQKSAARAIGVASDTLRNWEEGRTEPEVRFFPALIRFLGYDPLPEPHTRGQAIRRRRLVLGMSQERLADLAGVDEATVGRLEADTPHMARRSFETVQAVLDRASARDLQTWSGPSFASEERRE
jgi:transcriptional regulator with XRE-family HTH domain